MAKNKNPGNPPDDWQQRAKALLLQQKWDDLISLSSAVIPTLKSDADKANAYYLRGIAYNKKGEYDRAIADYNQAIKLNPDDATAYTNRGGAYNEKGEYDRAIADLNRAIELNPDDAVAYNNRGYAYRQKGEYDRAISDYNRAIELEPDDATAYNNRGYAYRQKGEHDLALADYNRAIELNPNYATAYNNRGNAYHAKDEHDLALADYNRAIKLDSDDAAAYNNRGNAYHAKGEHDLALADYNRAIKLDPDDAVAYNNRGAVFAAKGEHDKAIADWEKGIKLTNPQNPELVDNLLAGVKAATKMREQLSQLSKKAFDELGMAKGFEEREEKHNEAHKCSEGPLKTVLWGLFVFYFITFGILIYVKRGATSPWEIFPWITAIFLTSSPIIWLARILSREKTWHFALCEKAYANRLMALLLPVKARDEDQAELIKKFFDHHDLRGSAQLILGAKTEKETDEGLIARLINSIRQVGGKPGE